MPANRYRRSAEECRLKAERAQTEHERQSYLKMALAWDQLVKETEAFRRRASADPDGVIIPFDPDASGSTKAP